MRSELVLRYRLVAGDVPLESPGDRRQISFQQGANSQDVGYPANRQWPMLNYMGIDSNPQAGVFGIDCLHAPGNKRCSSTVPADGQVISLLFDPAAESAFKNPPIQIVDLVAGLRTRPSLDRVTGAERVTAFQIARHRYGTPHLIGRCLDVLGNANRPPETWNEIFWSRHIPPFFIRQLCCVSALWLKRCA